MDFLREKLDAMYDASRRWIFNSIQNDPEIAHEWFIQFSQFLHKTNLEEYILGHTDTQKTLDFKISNAAGFNKNADIPPQFLHYLGFDRVIVGSVTHDPHKGNQRPRIMRFPKTKSMTNWMGLPGIGSEAAVSKLEDYGAPLVPLTINVAATPGKTGNKAREDIVKTMQDMRACTYVDRFELNISCPNVSHQKVSHEQYRSELEDTIGSAHEVLLKTQELDLKVSPDHTDGEIEAILAIATKYGVRGLTVSNTTTHHDPRYIPHSSGRGGGSGSSVYRQSLDTQKKFYRKIYARKIPLTLNACGGIDSLERVHERQNNGAQGDIQIFTPLIFEGPKLLRILKHGIS